MELNSNYVNYVPHSVLNVEIFSHLGIEDSKQCELVCKLWNEIINQMENYQQKKETFFAKKLIPSFEKVSKELIDAVGGIKKYCSLPVLPIDCYIIQMYKISPSELSSPIMRGVDFEKRPFVTIKTNGRNKEDSKDTQFTVTIFFDTRFNEYRCNAGEKFDLPFGHPDSNITSKEWKRIKRLIHGENLEITNSYAYDSVPCEDGTEELLFFEKHYQFKLAN